MSLQTPNAMASNADFEFAALQEARNYRETLIREFAPYLRGDVIEIGAGIGQMTELLLQRAEIKRLIAVEPEADFAQKHREEFPSHELIEGIIDHVPADSKWDAILSINVLEHIGEDEHELVKYAHLLREQRGTLCLFVPARQEIYSPIDKDFGHFRRYSREELRRKLTNAGFSIVRLDYFNSLGYFAWWLNFRVLKKRSFEIEKVRFYDRMIFPIVHFLESRIIRPLIGQSLLAVVRIA